MIIIDTIVVKHSGTEVLTKHEKEWKNVCYNLKDNPNIASDDDGEEAEDRGKARGKGGRGDYEGGRGASESNGTGSNGRHSNGRAELDGLSGAITTRRMRDKGNM